MQPVKPTRSQLKRQAIVDAAKALFTELGVQGTSMDNIAATAQVSKRTVYNHFDTKEALVMHLINEMWHQSVANVPLTYDSEQTLQSQLQQLLAHELAIFNDQAYLDLVRVAFGHFFYHPELLRAEMEKYAVQETALIRWLEAAIADKRLKPMDIQMAHEQLHGLIKGCGFWPQMMKAADPLPKQKQLQVAEQSAAMFLSHYQS